MDLLGPCLTEHLDDFSAGGAPYYGVVYHHHPFAFEDLSNGVELHLDAEVADGLFGFDEGASHIVVSDEAQFHGDACLLAKSQGGYHAGVGNGHHHVCFYAALPGQLAPKLLANRVDVPVEDEGVGSGEVYEFEDAVGGVLPGKG